MAGKAAVYVSMRCLILSATWNPWRSLLVTLVPGYIWIWIYMYDYVWVGGSECVRESRDGHVG